MRHLGTRASDLVVILVWLNAFGALSALPQAKGANAVIVRKSPIVELAAPKKLLFLPFFNEAADQNFSWLENSIGSSIHDVAHKRYQYTKIDDADFSIYFINKGYSPSDLYDFKKITKIAHDLGVDGVIYGTFKPDAEKANVIVTGKILSVVDKEIIAEKTVTIPVSSEMFSGVEEVSDSLGDNIKNLFYPSDKGALIRAATLPGWGHRYKQRPGWGYFWGGMFWSSVAFTALSTFQLIRYSISYKNYTPENYTSPNGGVGLKDPAAVDAQVASINRTSTPGVRCRWAASSAPRSSMA